VKFRFESKKLEKLYYENPREARYPSAVKKAFFKRMACIESAADMRDLRALKSIRLEKLKRQRHLYSMRLGEQWRLLLRFEKEAGETVVIVTEVSKHYGG